jgi:hypothetical protein
MTAIADNPSGTKFAKLAQRYCALIEAHHSYDAEGLLKEFHRLVPALYGAALDLPASAPTADFHEAASSHDAWVEVYRPLRDKLGRRSWYWEVFDPYHKESDDPVIGDLADDLADIWRELQEGLTFWNAGSTTDAFWHWGFSFSHHWGGHATRALRAIYTLACHRGFEEPEVAVGGEGGTH